MAFSQRKLDKSINQSRGIFDKYIYRSDDTIAEIEAADYFSESRFLIREPEEWNNGIIEINASDGYFVATLNGGSIDDIVAGGPGVTNLEDGQVPKAEDGLLVYGGATVDSMTGQWTFDQSINVPPASVNVGNNITLSDFGEILATRNNATNINELTVTGEEIEAQGILLPEVPTSPPSETLAEQPIGTDFGPVLDENNPSEFILDPSVFSSSVPSDEFLILENIIEYAQVPDSKQARNEIWIGTDDTGFKIFDFTFDIDVGVTSLKPPNPQVFRSGNLYFVRTTPLGPGNYQLKGLQVGPSFFNKADIRGYPIQRSEAVTRETANQSKSRYLLLNDEYVSGSATTGGIPFVYDPTATTDTIPDTATFTPGDAGVSNPTVETTGAATFSQDDLVLITDTNANNGLYEVESHAANLLTVRGVGTVATVEGFTRDNFFHAVGGVSVGSSATAGPANIAKVNVSVFQFNSSGDLESGKESKTPITYTAIGNVIGPESSVDTAIAVFNGVTGKLIKEVPVTVDSNGNMLFTAPADDKVQIQFNDNSATLNSIISLDDSNNDFDITAISGNLNFTGGASKNINLSTDTGLTDINSTSGSILKLSNSSSESNFYVGLTDPEGSISADGGSIFIRDSGLDSDLYLKFDDGSNANWQNISTNNVVTSSSSSSIGISDDYTRISANGQTVVMELPQASTAPMGNVYSVKLIDIAGSDYGVLCPFSGDNIDGSMSERRMGSLGDEISVIKVGSSDWDILARSSSVIGEMSLVGGVINQGGIGTTPVVVTAFNNNVKSTNGIITADQANNVFDITHVEDATNGDSYFVTCTITFDFSNTRNAEFEIYVDGVATGVKSSVEGGGVGDFVNVTLAGTVNVSSSGHDVDVRVAGETGTNAANWQNAHWNMNKT